MGDFIQFGWIIVRVIHYIRTLAFKNKNLKLMYWDVDFDKVKIIKK